MLSKQSVNVTSKLEDALREVCVSARVLLTVPTVIIRTVSATDKTTFNSKFLFFTGVLLKSRVWVVAKTKNGLAAETIYPVSAAWNALILFDLRRRDSATSV